ncbi:hypothetical protein [Streptomyces sp. NRRL S-337]|uniref:hypothetical protein n=1 Tax=Streptomyces sp. NRRL S-337 TaxID=1463900 RepID=UPI00131C943B|nr:hypothetical protein [Streptomyces sp. NRRL S-337]
MSQTLPRAARRAASCARSEGRRQLASAASDGTVRLWSLGEQQQTAEVRVDGSLNCAAYDPVHGRILVGSAAGVVTLDLNLTPLREG